MGQWLAPAAPAAAVAVLNMNGVYGTLVFTERGGGRGLRVRVQLRGVPPGNHGLHVHEYGDLSGVRCAAAGSHYNPHGHTHGSRRSPPERHPGDFGNVRADALGVVSADFEVSGVHLADVIGRSVVLHSGEDDGGAGLGNLRAESLKTGNSGPRLACAVVGWAAA